MPYASASMPADWNGFRAAYFAELKSAAAQVAAKDLITRLHHGPVTLLYAARDERHNNVVARKDWLDRQSGEAD
jgi:uncharacterized protein YeaO (DUF488 family)